MKYPATSGQKLIALLLVFVVLLPGIAYNTPASAQPDLAERVNTLLADMPLDHKVGQMFMVSLFGEGLPAANEVFLRAMIPGAISAFSSNVNTPERTTATTNAWQTIATQIGAKVPMIVAIDHEGGPVTRLLPEQGYTALPWGAALGAMPAANTKMVGRMAAEELRAVGITMNLAPVADVRARAEPPYFVERRTFGPDPALVGSAVAAYTQGLQEGGVIATLKHFPGHGAAGDSHNFLPVVNRDSEEIARFELPPFEIGIKGGADAVMVGHLSVPALDPTPGIPASLSPKIVTDLLRKQLGFTGVILTDALDMGAIVDNYPPPVAAVMAVNAGIDMLATGPKMPQTQQLAMKQAIIDAVKAGEIAGERIDDSVRRILTLKGKYGLLDWSPLDARTATERVRAAAHQELLESIYLNAVAISHDDAGLLPLKPADKKIALIVPGIYPIIGRACSALEPSVKAYTYSTQPTDEEIVIGYQLGQQLDTIVIFTYNIREHPRQALLVNSVPPEKTVVVALQSPYDFESGIEPGAYVTSFNTYPPAFRAACAVLFGRHQAVGKFQAIPG